MHGFTSLISQSTQFPSGAKVGKRKICKGIFGRRRRGRGDQPEKKEEEETEGIGVREETNFGCKGCSQNAAFQDIVMGISKTEVNLKRLVAAAPQQKKQAKLVHYVATLREQLEQLAQERTSEGLPRVSKAVVNDFSEKIEAIASKLAAPLVRVHYKQDYMLVYIGLAILYKQLIVLLEEIADILMNENNGRLILDSTEQAVEHSLASTGRANVRAMKIYSESSKTTCFTWLAIFAMTCIFIMVVLLIRVT
ncbi:uncharacterized protein LOC112033518 [Quercus suber]|uniref:uncharacterized protein LOC112033518 n=1 Tax=Quercus suber TaxID=58331 RepID=UPI0032DF32D7